MAGWLHGVFVVDWLFVFPLCGFSLSLFCNYEGTKMHAGQWHKRPTARAGAGVPGTLPLTVCPVQLQFIMKIMSCRCS